MKIKPRIFFAIILVVLFGGAYLYHSTVLDKEAKKIVEKLYQEIKQIELPSSSKLEQYKSFHKSTNALVYADYFYTADEPKPIAYYKNALEKSGWKYCCEKNDEFNKEAIFEKGEFAAYISLKNEKAQKSPKKYRLSMSWELVGCGECQ
jgi:hypothetical protein